jgi:hypothetical protein
MRGETTGILWLLLAGGGCGRAGEGSQRKGDLTAMGAV